VLLWIPEFVPTDVPPSITPFLAKPPDLTWQPKL
jgi:hypothetical protein